MYEKIKIATYLAGGIITFYFSLKQGVEYIDTIPVAFKMSGIMLLIAVAWVNIDYTLTKLLKAYTTDLKPHHIAIVLNLLFLLYIIGVSK